MYQVCMCLVISDASASLSDNFAGIHHSECKSSCQWHPCQQWHHSHTQQGTMVYVTLGSTAVASWCWQHLRWRQGIMYMWTVRTVMTKIHLIVTRSWQMFPVYWCFKYISLGQVGREFLFSWLIEEEELRLAELCQIRHNFYLLFLQAGQKLFPSDSLARTCWWACFCFSAGFVATFRRRPTQSSRAAETARCSCLIQYIQEAARGKQFCCGCQNRRQQVPNLPFAGGPKLWPTGE